jgi:hypothetical protein
MAARHHGSTVHQVRRLAAHGWPVKDVAHLCKIAQADVRAIVQGPPPAPLPPPRPSAPVPAPRPPKPRPDPHRSIKGTLAVYVRRLHAAGKTDRSIARTLRLDLADVRGFLHRPPRSTAAWPSWRSPSSVATLPPPVAELPAAELPGQVVAEIPPVMPIGTNAWTGPTSPHASSGRRRPKLSDVDARLVRELRAEGYKRRELSEAFGISQAAIGRLLAWQTYPDATPRTELELEAPPAAGPTPTALPVVNRWED